MTEADDEHPVDVNLAGIATRAAILGCVFGTTIAMILTGYVPRPALPLYIAALALFHFLEFYTTAAYNPKNAKTDSFLLSSNGIAYWAAQAAGVIEYLIVDYAFPTWHKRPLTSATFLGGLVCLLFGQAIRSIAMAQAAQSFSHSLAYTKKDGHILVTGGLYSYERLGVLVITTEHHRISRHPSYLGFFLFGVGTQIMLSNPLSLLLFSIVLWRFFSERIR